MLWLQLLDETWKAIHGYVIEFVVEFPRPIENNEVAKNVPEDNGARIENNQLTKPANVLQRSKRRSYSRKVQLICCFYCKAYSCRRVFKTKKGKLDWFCFVCHVYPPLTRKRIVSLCFWTGRPYSLGSCHFRDV